MKPMPTISTVIDYTRNAETLRSHGATDGQDYACCEGHLLNCTKAMNTVKNELLAEIVAAYQTHNLCPLRRMFCIHEKGVDHVCPLVALAVHRGVVDRADRAIEIDGGANAALDWAAGLWGDDFVIGLLDGWDGQEQAKSDPDYVDGYALGFEAAKVLSPSDPPV